MSPRGNRRSLLAFATCLSPAFILASPLTAPNVHAEALSRRGNSPKIHCGNAPNVIAGDPVTAADIVVPSVNEGPPTATEDPSGYFPYLWCGAGTSTYVFIDPIGNYGFNKGTNAPIFWTAFDGGWNITQNNMKSKVSLGKGTANGDGPIDTQTETSVTWRIPVGKIAPTSGIQSVEIFARDANHQKLTYGVYGAALTIMKDFVLNYPLYADASYFQINDGKWGTLGNGYVGIVFNSNATYSPCYLKGNPAQKNGVPCAMPSNYPNN